MKCSSILFGVGNGSILQYSCPENSIDRGAWPAVVHKVTKHQTQLSLHDLYYYDNKCYVSYLNQKKKNKSTGLLLNHPKNEKDQVNLKSKFPAFQRHVFP